ncbi:unnamed protein product [Porites evermanni]|uniref:Uncharacterized protein n=1 Tax=Porites evermanni TaxID=104178 RepID=A0ABN8MAC0_9CNID|nr:unnamed protein product [Porites evermanni]
MCNGEIMGKDYTLEFVYTTRWRIKIVIFNSLFLKNNLHLLLTIFSFSGGIRTYASVQTTNGFFLRLRVGAKQ